MSTFSFPGQTAFYSGKVRDVYTIENDLLVMLASNRISAFDVILPRTIPYKGQVLNQIAAYMLRATKDICPNWLIDVPAPNASFGKRCEPFKIEMVVRGNLTGHAWRTYSSGKRVLCGVEMPERLKENTLKLFARGKEIAAKQGLILVDTKYEFGKIGDAIYLMDEIHTPDSSRYFYAEGFEQRQANDEKQKQLSKEFVREWLIENNFMGKEGQSVPEMSDEWIDTISKRYIELYEKIIGEKFLPVELNDDETFELITSALKKIQYK